MSQSGIILLLAALASHNHQVQAEKAKGAEVACMTQALYYEARGEGEHGQEAVAEVILHRVRSGAHPKTICGVVYEPHQFSFISDGSTLRPIDREAWQAASQLASRIVRGKLVTSLTRRALFYHQVDIQPAWASELVQTAKIGNHIFYRLPGRPHEGRATEAHVTNQPVATGSSKPRDA